MTTNDQPPSPERLSSFARTAGSMTHYWRDIELLPVGTVVKHMGFLWTIDKLLKSQYRLRYYSESVRGTIKIPYNQTARLREIVCPPNDKLSDSRPL